MVNGLTNKGIDIIPIKELVLGASDETIEIANQQNRVVITFDADFGELVFRKRIKNWGVILLRFTPKTSEQVLI